MPTPFATRLCEEYAGPEDYKFTSAIQLKMGTSLNGTFGAVQRFEPWTETKAKSLLDHHPVAIWSSLSAHLDPRAGIYGRMCTFYGGWGAAGMTTPSTVGEMISLHSAVTSTYGGTGDPGAVRITIPCNFDSTMQDTLKVPYGESGRPVFFYCFVETDIITTAADADRFMLTFRGSYLLRGRY